MSKSLEALCRPVVHAICQYWYASHAGFKFKAADIHRDLSEKIAQIRSSVEEDPILKRDFSKIECPLIFFIDYTIQEGGFNFGRDWQGFSRNYNEFSGDEKFFDFLTNTLDDPDSSEQLLMYYLFMGLGFNGCHSDIDYIERRMKVCAVRFAPGFCPGKDSLSVSDIYKNPQLHIKRRKKISILQWVVIACTVLFLSAFLYNFYVFATETVDYRIALRNAKENAQWGNDNKHNAWTKDNINGVSDKDTTLKTLPDFKTIQQGQEEK